jgi:2-succinyl-5-enolpyruvyl-6-hydroxy-3-cyclohexene-1-carboxylate synthase
MAYFPCHNLAELSEKLPLFWKKGAGILEIFTESHTNAAFFDLFKQNSPFRITQNLK